LATQEFQYLEKVLKDWYAPAIVNQIYTKSPFWAQVKKTSKGVTGRKVYIPLRHTLTEAVGGLSANEYSLVPSSRTQYDRTYIYQKRNYGRVQVDGLAIEASKGKGGWIDTFSGETKSVAEAFAIEIDQQVMGRGTAILGVASATNSSKVQAVDDPHGVTQATPGYMWFRKGMQVSYWDVNGNVFSPLSSATKGLIIASITPASNQITFSTSPGITSADGDFLVRFRSGSFSTGGVADTIPDTINTGNGAIMGIDRIVDDDQTNFAGDDIDPFQGINGATSNSWWRAQVMRSSNTILTEMKIQEDLDTIEQNTDGDTPNLAMTTYALRNKLIEIAKSERMVSDMKFVGGWEGIKYKGGAVTLPIMVHKFCPSEYWYYLNLKYIRFYTLKKLIWDNKGGGIIKPVAGEDQYEAWFKMYGNLGVDKRNAFGKSKNYTVA